MFCSAENTLAYQLGARPLTSFRNRAHVPLGLVVGSLKGYLSPQKKMATPEHDALWFYALNHLTSIVRQRNAWEQVLSAEDHQVLDTYNSEISDRAVRMFYYLLVICTRESRHAGLSGVKETLNKISSSTVGFVSSIRGKSSSKAVDALLNSTPSVTVGGYTETLRQIFYTASFSGGYGGPAWGAVADVLRDFVHGKISAETMLDVGFALAHNNGPIFNKGVLFNNYSTYLTKILDVQRGGQIPALIVDNGITGDWIPSDLIPSDLATLIKEYAKIYGSSLIGSGHVEWDVVEALGAVHSYPKEIQIQQAAHGMSDAVIKAKAEKEKKELEKMKKEQAEKLYISAVGEASVAKVGRDG